MPWVIKGIFVGFAFAILIGPIFFIYLETAFKKGIKFALMVGVGVWTADLALVGIMNFNLGLIKNWIDLNNAYFWFSILSGCILFGMGLVVILRKDKSKKQVEEERIIEENMVRKGNFTFLSLSGKGFLVNFFQPFVIFFWLGISISLTFKHKAMPMEKVYYFGGALLTRASIDLVKILLGRSIKKIYTPDKVFLFQRILGIILLFFGILLFANALSESFG